MTSRQLLIVGGKLALICTVAALVLALVNSVTEPIIVKNRATAFRDGLEAVLAQSGTSELTIGELVEVRETPGVSGCYPLTDAKGRVAGCIVALTGAGYGGEISLLAGYRANGEVFAVRMMENQETPGLGKKAEEPGYMAKFIGRGGGEPVPTARSELSPSEADAVTGATITFVAVAKAVRAGSEYARSLAGSNGRSQ